MVIKDSTYTENVSEKCLPSLGEELHEKIRTNGPLASPLDRVAAAVIDNCIVLTPIIYLVLAPFQRVVKEGAIYGSQNQMIYAVLLGFAAVIGLLLTYQTICVWVWGATIGKMFLGLRVECLLSGHKIKLMQSLTRASFWILSWGFLGVPFASIFSNVLRRPLHDRISDVIVVTRRRERIVFMPTRQEIALVGGVYWAFGVAVAFMLTLSLIKNVSNLEDNSERIAELEGENMLCSDISTGQNDWPRENKEETTRLSVAMALYAAGTIDLRCLQNEVEYLFLTSEESPMLYLAKAFIYADQPEVSEMYLEKVCGLNNESYECEMSQIIRDIAEDKWEMASQKFVLNYENAPVFFNIWATRQHVDRGEFALAQKFATQIPELKILSDFMVPAQTKILWGLHRESEVRSLETTMYSTLNDSAKLDLASFICFENLWATCDQVSSKSCQQIDGLLTKVEDGLASAKTSLAYLRKWECEHENNGQAKDYASLDLLAMHPDVSAFISGISDKNSDDISELLKDESLNDDLASEVLRRMLNRAQSVGSVRMYTKTWSQSRGTLSWIKMGETLFAKYFEMEYYEDSLKVIDEILSRAQYLSKNILQSGVVAAMRSNQPMRARKLMLIYAEKYPLPMVMGDDIRGPASDSEFASSVLQLLRRGK